MQSWVRRQLGGNAFTRALLHAHLHHSAHTAALPCRACRAAALAIGFTVYRRKRHTLLTALPTEKLEDGITPVSSATGPSSFGSPGSGGIQGWSPTRASSGSPATPAAAGAATRSPARSETRSASAAAKSGFSLAALARRSGAGRLSRHVAQAGHSSQQDAAIGSLASSTLASSLDGGLGSSRGPGAPLSPRPDPAVFSAVGGEGDGSRSLPLSYVSTGWPSGGDAPAVPRRVHSGCLQRGMP